MILDELHDNYVMMHRTDARVDHFILSFGGIVGIKHSKVFQQLRRQDSRRNKAYHHANQQIQDRTLLKDLMKWRTLENEDFPNWL